MPPRRWKLNDCTSNAFYFDFNQHVQKLLDKETTKCLFQKWFPIFIIALTLAGVRHLRVDTLACGVKKGSVLPTCGFPRNRCMRMFPIQLILTDSYITSTFRILSPYIYIYIYILLVSSLISTEVHVDHHRVSGPPFCGSSSILEVCMVHWSWHLSDHLRVLSECINMSKRVWRGN